MKDIFNKKSVRYAGLGLVGLAGAFGLVNSGVELADGNMTAAAVQFVEGLVFMSGAAAGAVMEAQRPAPQETPDP